MAKFCFYNCKTKKSVHLSDKIDTHKLDGFEVCESGLCKICEGNPKELRRGNE